MLHFSFSATCIPDATLRVRLPISCGEVVTLGSGQWSCSACQRAIADLISSLKIATLLLHTTAKLSAHLQQQIVHLCYMVVEGTVWWDYTYLLLWLAYLWSICHTRWQTRLVSAQGQRIELYCYRWIYCNMNFYGFQSTFLDWMGNKLQSLENHCIPHLCGVSVYPVPIMGCFQILTAQNMFPV